MSCFQYRPLVQRRGALWLAFLIGPVALSGAPGSAEAIADRPPDRELQESASVEEVLELLREGNERFSEGSMSQRDWPEQIRQSAEGQYPLATVINCIDSRVPAELIFDQGLGTLFNVRVAGNVVGEDALGSLEYGSRIAGTRLILVLGHSHCGAIKGAIHEVELGHLTGLLAKIRPAMEEAADESGLVTMHDADRVTELNVRHTMGQIRSESAVLREMIDAGSVVVRGAVYDVETGKVRFLDH